VTFSPAINDTPFNNPSAQPDLVQMWRSAINKARQEIPPPPLLTAALIINFDGAGQPLTVGMGGIPELPPGAFRIIGAHLAAGIWSLTDLSIVPIAVTATVDIQLATQGTWVGGSRPLYGSARPGLSSQAETDIDVTGWITELQPGDMLAYALATFTGTASVLTLTLTLRRIDVAGIDAAPVTDTTGSEFTDANGRSFTTRS
jgi:hypothetical protein